MRMSEEGRRLVCYIIMSSYPVPSMDDLLLSLGVDQYPRVTCIFILGRGII